MRFWPILLAKFPSLPSLSQATVKLTVRDAAKSSEMCSFLKFEKKKQLKYMKVKKDELNSRKDYMLSFVVERYNISKIEWMQTAKVVPQATKYKRLIESEVLASL